MSDLNRILSADTPLTLSGVPSGFLPLLLGGVFFLFTGIILHALRILMDEIKANLER